jgi:hypothetical protein
MLSGSGFALNPGPDLVAEQDLNLRPLDIVGIADDNDQTGSNPRPEPPTRGACSGRRLK